MHTIMTRLGSNCKMIFLGDVKQKDLTGTKVSSLPIIMEKFSTKEAFGIISFTFWSITIAIFFLSGLIYF